MADDYEIRGIPGSAGTTDDGTTTHRIGVGRIDDLLQNKTNVRAETFIRAGHPLQWLQATVTAGVNTAGDYPNDGDGLTVTAGNGGTGSTAQITLASGAPNWDLTGWCVIMLSGAAVGEVIQILAYNTSTKQVTLSDRAWGTIPSASDVYTIGLNTFRREYILVKGECEGPTQTCEVIPIVFDYPRNPKTSGADQGKLGLDGVKRAPRRGYLGKLLLDNYGVSDGVTQATYNHMRVRSDQPLGALLAKVRLHTVPAASKKVMLWLAAV